MPVTNCLLRSCCRCYVKLVAIRVIVFVFACLNRGELPEDHRRARVGWPRGQGSGQEERWDCEQQTNVLTSVICYFLALFQSFFTSAVRLNLFWSWILSGSCELQLLVIVSSKDWLISLCLGLYVFGRTMFLVSLLQLSNDKLNLLVELWTYQVINDKIFAVSL